MSTGYFDGSYLDRIEALAELKKNGAARMKLTEYDKSLVMKEETKMTIGNRLKALEALDALELIGCDILDGRTEFARNEDVFTVDIPEHALAKLVIAQESRIPTLIEVASVDTYNNRVVKVTFTDGTFTKSVCAENDIFDLDVGITICLMKKMLGANGHKLYNDLMRNVHQVMTDNAQRALNEAAEEKEIKAQRRKANEKRMARNAKKRREMIDIQKEAIIEAYQEMNKNQIYTYTGDDGK